MSDALGLPHDHCDDFLKFGMAVDCPNGVCVFPVDLMISVDVCEAVLVYLTGGMSQLVNKVRTAKKSADKIAAAAELRNRMKKGEMQKAQNGRKACESAKEALQLVEKLTACLLGHDGLAGAFAK